MKKQTWGNQFRTTTVCVDSYENGVLSGWVYNPLWAEGQPFKSLSQFLLLMEQMLDEIGFPQPYNEARNFAPVKELPGQERISDRHLRGKRMTFQLQILFRQHASWQGCATWEEARKMQSFRSVLELILLMDSALRCEEVA